MGRNPRERAPHGLARWLSKYGLASRAEAERWVREGRVALNGRIVRDPYKVCLPSVEEIQIDGKPVRTAPRIYLALHKPKGYVTTSRDPEGRPTAYDLVPRENRNVHAVGRLDKDTSGLLLFTNDTHFAARVTEAEDGVEKEYIARVKGTVSPATASSFSTGVLLDGRLTLPAECTLLGADAGSTRVRVVLTEGRNRQVRRMWEILGHPVVELKRVRIGPIRLGRLPEGKTRPLTAAERRAFASP